MKSTLKTRKKQRNYTTTKKFVKFANDDDHKQQQQQVDKDELEDHDHQDQNQDEQQLAATTTTTAPNKNNNLMFRPKLSDLIDGDYDDDDDDGGGGEGQEGSNTNANHDQLVRKLTNGRSKEEKYRWQAQRTEASSVVSEFGMTTAAASAVDSKSGKVSLSKLLSIAKDPKARKTLKTFTHKEVLPVPLKQPLAQKAVRQANFEQVKQEISKYDSVVKEIRRADQLIFPRDDQASVQFKVAEQLGTSNSSVSKVSKPPTTSLEAEIANTLSENDQNLELDSRPLTENELAVLRARNVEEARAIHREIQRRRLLVSYQEAKYRRKRKIKSKQYHRLKNKQTIRKEVQEFDEALAGGVENSDMAAAKLAEMDRLRALERASLKHSHQTGKWAKYQKIRAKYDTNAREEMNRHLDINASLMRKRSLALLTTTSENGEDDDDEDEDDGDGDEDKNTSSSTTAINGETLIIPNNYNPWISNEKRSKKNKKIKVEQTESKIDDNTSKDDNSIEKFFQRRVAENFVRAQHDERKLEMLTDALGEERELIEDHNSKSTFDGTQTQQQLTTKASTTSTPTLTTTIDVVENENDDDDDDRDQASSSSDDDDDESSAKTVTNLNPEQWIVSLDDITKKRGKLITKSATTKEVVIEASDDDDDGDGEEVTTITKQRIENEIDFTENDDMRKYLHEAFHDDDVVDEFLKEKQALDSKNSANNTGSKSGYLPGWGAWAGDGIKESRRKRAKMVRKFAKAEKRLDRKICNAIIMEGIDRFVEKYRISNVQPSLVQGVESFERKCAKPIGSMWNPQTVSRSLTEPKVITKIGKIIEPLEHVS